LAHHYPVLFLLHRPPAIPFAFPSPATHSPQDTIAPHVVNVVQWFNKFSRWVMSEICNWSDANHRALCIKFFLRHAF
jgi:hypothetical protein